MKPQVSFGKTLSNAAAIAILGTALFFVIGPSLIYALIDLARAMGAK